MAANPQPLASISQPKSGIEDEILSILEVHEISNIGVTDIEKMQAFNQSVELLIKKHNVEKISSSNVKVVSSNQ